MNKEISNGVLVYRDADDEVLPRYRHFTDSHIPVLEIVGQVYEAQRFYPEGLTQEELLRAARQNPRLLSPYTLVRRDRGSGKLKAINYLDHPFFREKFAAIADGLETSSQIAEGDRLPDAFFIKQVLQPQIMAFRQGNFGEAMNQLLNLWKYPAYDLRVWLLDRYCDELAGTKLSIQGWSTKQDNERTRDFNKWVEIASRSEARKTSALVIACKWLRAAGMPVDLTWSGNTVPSENLIRKKVRPEIYVFSNRMQEKLEEDLAPVLLSILPEGRGKNSVVEDPDWLMAFETSLVLHELGHGMADFSAKAERRLLELYPGIKEAFCDMFAAEKVQELPLSKEQKNKVFYALFVRARERIDKYRSANNGRESQIMRPYAIAGALFNNSMVEGGAALIEDGIVYLGGLKELSAVASASRRRLNNMLRVAEKDVDKTRSDIEERINSPIPYMAEAA